MSPGAWLALIILIFAAVGFLRLVKKREISEKQFEIESRRTSLMGTGLQEFQGFLEPEKRAALKVVQEEKRKTDQTISGAKPAISGERPDLQEF